MRTPEQIAQECEDITLDTRFEKVRAWRERTGGKACGHLPIYVPREIIEAAGMLPVGVAGGGDQVEIIRGDAYFQSYICQIPRSVIEMGLNERLDCLDGMIFPATCDVIRNLSGMWKILFPDRYVAYLDLPHNHEPEIGGKFYAHELRRIAKGLGERTGVEPTDERLLEALARHDDNRTLVEELYDLRAERPHAVPTSELYVVLRAGFQLPVEEHNAVLAEYIEAAKRSDRQPLDQARVVVVGTFCEQPPLGLLKTLERAGCYIVDDDLLVAARFLRGRVLEGQNGGSPWDLLARAWFDRGLNVPSRYVPGEKKGEWLVRMCRERHAEGVIFCAPSFCDPALLEQPMLQNALDAAGIAHTNLRYAENTAQFGAIHEQSGTFADSIKLWSQT